MPAPAPQPPSRLQQDLLRLRQDHPYASSTLAKGLMLLQCFIQDPRPQANSELAQRLGMPRPTVSRLCRTLQALGYLEHDAQRDRYFMGPACVSLAYPYLMSAPLAHRLRPAMQALATRMRGAVSMGIALDLDVLYLQSCSESPEDLKHPAIGAVRGIVETAMGRAWLATLPARERERWLQRLAQERPHDLARCRSGLDDSLQHYATRGFALNLGDAGLGVLAVGVRSPLRCGPHALLFNCAVPGYSSSASELVATVGPGLLALVQQAQQLWPAGETL